MKDDLGLKLKSIPLSDLGRAKRITVDKENTTIVSYNDNSAAVMARIDQLSRQIDETTSDYDREKLQERRAGSRERANRTDCTGFSVGVEEENRRRCGSSSRFFDDELGGKDKSNSWFFA